MLEPARNLQAVLERETAALEVGAVEFDSDGNLTAHRRARGLDDFQQEPRPIFQRTAPLVAAQVGTRAQELRDKVAVRGMDLYPVKPGFGANPRSLGKAPDQFRDLRFGQRHRLAKLTARQTKLDR